jgi:hypothetical protein
MIQRRTIILTTVLILTALLAAGGCVKRVAEEREPRPEIVWPQAPEIPRISFVNALSKPEDLQIRMGMLRRFFDYLIGKTQTSIVSPYGVEADSSGRLYVVDTFIANVHVFDY